VGGRSRSTNQGPAVRAPVPWGGHARESMSPQMTAGQNRRLRKSIELHVGGSGTHPPRPVVTGVPSTSNVFPGRPSPWWPSKHTFDPSITRSRSRVAQWDRGAGANVRQRYRTLTGPALRANVPPAGHFLHLCRDDLGLRGAD
jgi:hypothetical protein